MKDELCEAFCGDLLVRSVPAGLAVSTTFDGPGGDALGFYVIGPNGSGKWHIEDDGATIPLIEAVGADLETKTRSEAFKALLEEYGALYDEYTCELRTDLLIQSDLPQAAMRFVALLLRLQDLVLLTPERVASTFREDAIRDIREIVGDRAEVLEGEPVHRSLVEFSSDLLIRATGRDPVAVFLGQTDQKIYEALLLQMAAAYEANIPCSVVVLLEHGGSVSQKMRQRADNRLASVPVYRGDEQAAIARIYREALGAVRTIH